MRGNLLNGIRRALLLAALCCAGPLAAQVGKLQCEYLENPLGVDVPNPRLRWSLGSETGRQTAWRIVAGCDSTAVAAGEGSVWDSGPKQSDAQLVRYAGAPLQPRTRYFWRVEVWNGGIRWSSPVAWFETGHQVPENWRGDWISDSHDIRLKPAACFRTEAQLRGGIRSARAYIAAAGLYELTVNGCRVGDGRLNPLYTRYDRRTLYLTHDLTPYLTEGENVFGVMLGNGWYNHQSTAVWNFDMAPWRGRPKFCADIRIAYADGSEQWIVTDGRWRTAPGPVVFNSIYTAEHYDARREMPGWDTPGFDASAWKKAVCTSAPAPKIVSQQVRPIRDVASLHPVAVKRLSDSCYLFDLGRNIAGVSEISLAGEAGTTLRLVHAERLKKDGTADLSNIDYHYRPTDDSDPFQTDIFILKGGEPERFRARFNYKGFRYVQVECDRPVVLTSENLRAHEMCSDVPAAGRIHASDTLINRIWAAANSSYRANLFGYPTDCPTREKNGWTGDAHIAVETGLYNFDAITVYEKWLADHQDEQQPNGVLPAIIPTGGWGYHWGNGIDWTSTIALIPWNIYLFYGDIHLLESVYDNIRRYVDHVARRFPTGLTDWGLGDWIPIRTRAVKELTSSVYFYADASILARAAGLLGRKEDAGKYGALAAKIRRAVNEKYLDPETGVYASGSQTEQSFPLYWGVVPDSLRERVADRLAERVRRDGQLDVGLHGTKSILNALSENGYAGLAYELASRDEYPSWGWWIRRGETTLCENWDLDRSRDISLNHIMFGEIGAWYYKGLGGIFPDADVPGFKHTLLRPNFVAGLREFEARHTSPYGEIVSAWKRHGDRVTYQVQVPANTTADLTLTGRRVQLIRGDARPQRDGAGWKVALGPGSYEIKIVL